MMRSLSNLLAIGLSTAEIVSRNAEDIKDRYLDRVRYVVKMNIVIKRYNEIRISDSLRSNFSFVLRKISARSVAIIVIGTLNRKIVSSTIKPAIIEPTPVDNNISTMQLPNRLPVDKETSPLCIALAETTISGIPVPNPIKIKPITD